MTSSLITADFPIAPKKPGHYGKPDYSRMLYGDVPSHDFLTALIKAEIVRRHHGVPEPLRVRFVLIDGQLGAVDFGAHSIAPGVFPQPGITRAYSDQMIVNVLRPAIEMMGAIEEPPVELAQMGEIPHFANHVEYDYHLGALVDAARQGIEVPRWQIPQWAIDEAEEFLDGSQPVILTLRETTAQPQRNSDLEAWLEFALSASRMGFDVLFLRDTARAHEKLPRGWTTWPRASENTFVRAALYQRALVNMMVCTGPAEWVKYGHAPYLLFKQIVHIPGWPRRHRGGWIDQDHMDIGDQYPWASPHQRMTWRDDSYRSLMTEFLRLMEESEAEK